MPRSLPSDHHGPRRRGGSGGTLVAQGAFSLYRKDALVEVGGWPEYKGTPYKDSDGDGMPDDWETAHGLNPKDAVDATGDPNDDGYTNIEDFINGLDPKAKKVDWADLKNNIDPQRKASRAP